MYSQSKGSSECLDSPEMDDLIEVVNTLQNVLAECGHTLDISLPQIVAVGCQSAGKSSVLENFVGREFLPRGSGVVTRRPTVVQLEPCQDEYAVFLHKGKEKFTDFQEVMEEIRNETLREPGPVGFSSIPISLKIYSPNVLKLTLVDLPGLIKVAIGDQPEDSIKEVRNMVLEYIEQPKSLILAVSPANQDIANSDALEIAKTVDPERVRTIGVLTKLDLMDEGTNAKDILENKKIPLKKGYVGVLNRSQKDIDEEKDISYCIEKEKQFFASMPCYKHMADKMGSPYLQRMLNHELRKHIKESLPAVRKELFQKLTSLQKELIDFENILNCNTSGESGLKFYMIKLVQEFVDQFSIQIFGYSEQVNMKEFSAGALINFQLYNNVEQNLKLPQIPKEEELIVIIANMHGIRNTWSVPSLAIEAVSTQLLQQFIEPLDDFVDNIAHILHSCISKATVMLDSYPNLKNELQYLIGKSIDEAALSTKGYLEKHIAAEKYFVNTYHQDFEFPELEEEDAFTPRRLCDFKVGSRRDDKVDKVIDCKSDQSKTMMKSLSKNSFAKQNANILSIMIEKYLKIQQKQIGDVSIKYVSYFLIKEVLDYVKSKLIPTLMESGKSNFLLEDLKKDLTRMKEIQDTCSYLKKAMKAVQNFH